ncbi:MAG: CBS domain-containing protein [Alphaproteobacteria bacterium]|nr:CBS domain-containing protein [Alphaproteobacteria bacterium]
MRVRDWMTTDPRTVGPTAPVDEVVGLMHDGSMRHLFVVDDGGHLLGLISERDLLGRALGPLSWLTDDERDQALHELLAREVMTEEPDTVTPDTRLADAARLLRDRKHGCLPVVDGGRLVGVLTEHDFVRLAAAEG